MEINDSHDWKITFFYTHKFRIQMKQKINSKDTFHN